MIVGEWFNVPMVLGIFRTELLRHVTVGEVEKLLHRITKDARRARTNPRK
jgi:hypothetical protein